MFQIDLPTFAKANCHTQRVERPQPGTPTYAVYCNRFQKTYQANFAHSFGYITAPAPRKSGGTDRSSSLSSLCVYDFNTVL